MNNPLKNPRTQVFYSDDLLENILKHLDLKEQLKLVRIAKRFKYILEKVMWPKDFTDIILYRSRYINIICNNKSNETLTSEVVKNEVKQFKMVLSHNQCEYFLHLNAKNIESLKVCSEYYMLRRDITTIIRNIQMFRNLKQLIAYRLIISDDFMQKLSRKCKKLKKLHLLKCCNENFEPLIPGGNLDLEHFCLMEHLQELEMQNDKMDLVLIKSLHLQEIFVNLNLKKLILNNFSITDSELEIKETCNNKRLEIVNTGIISMSFWPTFMEYLEHFEQLKELFINVNETNIIFNIKIVNILARNCKQLKNLSLSHCVLNLNDFRDLKQLKHLSLNSCNGLTFLNFQEILGGLSLKAFCLINTPINGEINHIYVSPTLEELTIDAVDYKQMSYIFQMSLQNFQNLNTLKWFNGDIKDTWLIDKCPKLQYLLMPFPESLKKRLFGMISLKQLTLTSCLGLSWCFLLNLIRNLKLKRLQLETNETIENCEIPLDACGIKTTLAVILLPFNIFIAGQLFWLDLLDLNEKLCFVIYGPYEVLMDFDWLEELIYCDIFGRRVKFLRICGFKFDCLDMQKDFNRAIQNINKYTSYYRYKNANFTLEM